MVTNQKYVLILGAGAHVPYGFPTGAQLVEKIIRLYPKMEKDAEKYQIFGKNKLIPGLLAQELKNTGGTVTIDRFVDINRNMSDDARWAAATVLCDCESACMKRDIAQVTNGINQDWMKYLFQKMIDIGGGANRDVRRFQDNNVAFITFNYDRLLEYFMYSRYSAVVKYSGMTKEEIRSVLDHINIYHVYGKMGDLAMQNAVVSDAGRMVFGGDNSNPMISTMDVYTKIEMIFDVRDQSDVMKDAREAIMNADRIMFLGFGYDEVNLRLLGAPGVFDGKQMYGTALGMTRNEIENIRRKLVDGHRSVPSINVCGEFRDNPVIEDCDSLTLLRNYLVPDANL